VLARFAPLYLQATDLLTIFFILGLLTALVGTLWKLMQSDVKRMLACSTMGQMGFMIAQCGLGLFPAAVAHLCWHGMFKAYLFLASGSAAQEKRFDLQHPPSASVFAAALLCGLAGASTFTWAGNLDFHTGDTTLFLIALCVIAGAQLARPILQHKTAWQAAPLALLVTTTAGALYGFSVHAFKAFLEPLDFMQPQDLNAIHFIGFIILLTAWLLMLFRRPAEGKAASSPAWMLRLYVTILNASQPHPKTVTAHRNDYQYR